VKTIGFDIETVPQKTISRAQQEWLDGRLGRDIRSNGAEDENDEERAERVRKIMGTSPFLGNIVCISLGEVLVNGDIQTQSFTGPEDELLTEFWEIMKKLNGALFVSFNGLSFDVPFISHRSLKHGIKPTSMDFLNTRRYSKYPQFDIMKWASDWGFPSPTLDLMCDLTGVDTSKTGAIKAQHVAQAFDDGRIAEIAEYCEADVIATLEVYKKYKPYVRS
jgi:predicted PolB exonuclease-like 3'-5' exonuclease